RCLPGRGKTRHPAPPRSALSAGNGTLSATGAAFGDDETFFRGMVTAGLELRWPILFSTTSATHIVEPIAQIFARPDEAGAGRLPNEDAQSFVFDASNLFERDKFTGFDRVEGGTRANLGLRYTGTLDNGVTLHGVFGQSYHLAGTNPYNEPDFVNVGANSGLETDVSDFVGSFAVRAPNGFSARVGGRFDEKDFSLERLEAGIGYEHERFSASLEYARQEAQPIYAFDRLREELTVAGSFGLDDHWRLAGTATYDLATDRLDQHAIGLQYDCDCFTLGLVYSQDRDRNDKLSNNFSLNFSFRTLGDGGIDFDDGLNF
ncbi:MAG: LPS assembly protein LptD, partial [Pseudomonadota bacterium]